MEIKYFIEHNQTHKIWYPILDVSNDMKDYQLMDGWCNDYNKAISGSPEYLKTILNVFFKDREDIVSITEHYFLELNLSSSIGETNFEIIVNTTT